MADNTTSPVFPVPRIQPGASIGIIGAGQVGTAAANAIVLGAIADEVLLVDINASLRDAQVRDLSDVSYASNSKTRVRAATHHEAGQCDIVVIATGSNISLGETSSLCLYQNVAIIKSVMMSLLPLRSDTIILVVASPVDLITSLVRDLSGLPDSQVIGTGTFLDSIRLRGLLADSTGISAKSIDLYVVGMHGPSQIAAWSTATVGGIPIDACLPSGSVDRVKLEDECKRRSETIIRVKGSTPLGIGSIVEAICSSIMSDKRDVRPVSCFQPTYGCCLSLPVVLGRKGVIKTIEVPFSQGEQDLLTESARELGGDLLKIQGLS